MSQLSLNFSPLVPSKLDTPQEAGIDPNWAPWATRLETLLTRACKRLGSRAQRARQLTVTLEGLDGSSIHRSLELPRALGDVSALRPAALGILRLLLADWATCDARISLRFNELSEITEGPIRFKAYLDRKKKTQRLESLRRLWTYLCGRQANA
jgi:hypothetical protein